MSDTKTVTVKVTLTNPNDGRGAMEAPTLAELVAAALRRELVEQLWGIGLYRAVAVEGVTEEAPAADPQYFTCEDCGVTGPQVSDSGCCPRCV